MSTFQNEVSKTAVLQIPGEIPDGSKRRITCEFGGMERRRLQIRNDERIPISTPVSLEYNDALFLGEVFACRAAGSGGFEIEIEVEQILTGLESLIGLRARLLGEGFAHTEAQALSPVRMRARL
ncbi:MAG: hypothetical protein JO270_19150 [Acidobacteriaceae bacterium]|nr:hypothetical protein [Acidobacteriaceae bacterium]